jgi:transcriptional regulator with GAF, ATPase, and Fis domain
MPDQPSTSTPVQPVVASREQQLARIFVALADTLVADFDITEFLTMLTQQCVELLNCAAAGVLLLEPGGGLRVAATSAQRAELLELFAVETDAGPCVDCVRSGEPVSSPDLTTANERWPRYAAAADACGYRAVQALPMRLRTDVIGVLSLFNTAPVTLAEDDVKLGQALADLATIGLLQHRHIEHGDQVADQLQKALTSRILIEQAKGVLAQRGSTTPEEAFEQLRRYCRARSLRMTDVADTVVHGTADFDAILAPAHPDQPNSADRRPKRRDE